MSTGTSAPLVTFIVPVLNDAARLARCLDSIAANGAAGIEVIVVDNGSTDGSDRVAQEKGATLIRKPHTPVSAMRNAGATIALGDVLGFVDADHEIDPLWVSATRSALGDLAIGAAGAPCTNEGRTWVQRTYHGLRARAHERQEVSWLGAGNLAVRRAAFMAVGGFDEHLTTCEDVDLCRRLRARGWRIVADPQMRNVHLGDPATLYAVLSGEAWRGRDNLTVSFRRPLDWQTIISALVPVVALGTTVGVLIAIAARQLPVAVALAAGLVFLVGLRAARISVNRRAWRPLAMLQSLLVAACYEQGRAFGLLVSVGHRNHRRSSAALSDPP
jgi:hypothetical protein